MTTRALYHAQETTVTWRNTGGTEILTLTSLGASGAGRLGEVHDFGSGSKAIDYMWRLRLKWATATELGESVEVRICRSNDNSVRDGTLGASDAAITAGEELNCLLAGAMIVDRIDGNSDFINAHGFFRTPERYLSPVIVNRTADALSSTATDHQFDLIPIFPEAQDEA